MDIQYGPLARQSRHERSEHAPAERSQAVLEDRTLESLTLWLLGELRRTSGDEAEAMPLFERDHKTATACRRERRADRVACLYDAAEALGEALSEFIAAWAAGRAVTPDEAIAFALEEPSSNAANSATSAVSRPWAVAAVAGITEREREVAGLVGQGLSTRQIA